MFELLTIVIFLWLSVRFIGFFLSLAWGAAKFLSLLLFFPACLLLGFLLLFAGGALLFLPLILIAAACGVLKMAL